MRKKLLTLLGIVLPLLANAYSFESNGIYYDITSSTTVRVTYKKFVSGFSYNEPVFPPNAYNTYIDWYDETGYPYSYILNDYTSSSITIPSSVTYNNVTYQVTGIGSLAFVGSSAETITLPTSIKTIESGAFKSCSSLKSVIIPNGVTNIKQSAFEGCSSMESLTIPRTVTKIEEGAFIGCTGSVKIEAEDVLCFETEAWDDYDNQYTKRNYPFAGSGFSEIHLSSSKLDIVIPGEDDDFGRGAFSYCRNLKKFSTSGRVVKIKGHAFGSCNNLTSIDLGYVSEIGDYAFEWCQSLNSVVLGEYTREGCSIGRYAFDGCGLKTVELSPYVKNVAYNAFNNCSGITSVINNSVYPMPIGNRFPNSAEIHVVNFLKEKLGNTTGWNNENVIGDLEVPDNFILYTTPEGKISNLSMSVGYRFYTSSTDKLVTLKEHSYTDGIGVLRFEGAMNEINYLHGGTFDDIALHNKITLISSSTFENCKNLKSVRMPKNLYAIWGDAFKGCTALESLEFPNSLAVIHDGAFENCTALSSIICNATTPPSCTISAFRNVTTQNVMLNVPKGAESLYANDECWGTFKSSCNIITLGTSDYATYCSDVNLDFSEVEGLKAYIASSFNPSTGALIITRIDNVPAGVGVLLKGTAGESYSVPSTTDVSVVANLMKGNTTSITLDPTTGEYTNFVLSQNSEGVMGFYRFNNSITMPAHKAWLQIPTSAIDSGSPAHARGFRFVEEGDEMTGIADIEENSANSDFIYDLQGRRLNSQPAHGLYIQNGKKIIK